MGGGGKGEQKNGDIGNPWESLVLERKRGILDAGRLTKKQEGACISLNPLSRKKTGRVAKFLG